jgi:hypothetical protein
MIADCFTDSGETLLIIDEWGVWPTEEFSSLLNAALNGFGDPRTLREAPAFLCSSNEDIRDFVRLPASPQSAICDDRREMSELNLQIPGALVRME